MILQGEVYALVVFLLAKKPSLIRALMESRKEESQHEEKRLRAR